MPLRGNALLRRVRRHRSMTTLYRSSQFEAPVAPIAPWRPLPSLGTQAGASRVMAQLMPARSDLPFGQLIPADGARVSPVPFNVPPPAGFPQQTPVQLPARPQSRQVSPPGQVARVEQPTIAPPATTRLETTTPQQPPRTAESPPTPPARSVQREPAQPPAAQPRPDLPASATSDFSWISDNEWNQLKQFAEGHQEHLARQAETPEMIQRAEQEKAEQEAQRRRETEITRRQELARRGKLPKADISYLSTETAGTTPIATPSQRPTRPLQRTAEDAGERPATPAPDVPTSPDAKREFRPAPQERVQPAVEDAPHQTPAPIQAKATSEVKPLATPPVAPVEPAKRPESPPKLTETPQTTEQAKPVEQVETLAEVQRPAEQVDHQEPTSEQPVSEEQPQPEPGGIRRLFDAARSLLRREEHEAPEPRPSEAVKPGTVLRHEADQPEELGPTEPIATAPPTTAPAIQRETADTGGPQTPGILTDPGKGIEPMTAAVETPLETPVQQFQPSQTEPGEPATALAQEPSQESPVPGPTPAIDLPATPEPAKQSSPPPATKQPGTPVRQAGLTPAAVQRTMEEPPDQEITTTAAPPTASPVLRDEDQPVTGRPSQPTAPAQDVAPSTPAPSAAETAPATATPGIQRETAESPEIAETTAIGLPPDSGYDFDAGDAETIIQPVPLESAWPVQQMETPRSTGTPQAIKKPAGPVAQRKPAGIDQAGEHVHETIKDIAPEVETDSSIELITPRRPRPTLSPKIEAAPAGVQREVELEQPEAAPPSEAALQSEESTATSEVPSPPLPGASEIQRQEHLPAKPSGDHQQPIAFEQPADVQAPQISAVTGQPEVVEDAIDRQPEATSERPILAGESPVTADAPFEAAVTPPTVQRSPDMSSPQAPSAVPGSEAETRVEPSEPYPVPTPIGDLPSDLWQMLGEKPPARQPTTQAPDARPQTVQRQADTQPQQIITEVFRTPDLQREDDTAGRKETAGTTEEAAGEGDEEKKSEIDVEALAQKVYPEIKRRLEVEWERGRGRFR